MTACASSESHTKIQVVRDDSRIELLQIWGVNASRLAVKRRDIETFTLRNKLERALSQVDAAEANAKNLKNSSNEDDDEFNSDEPNTALTKFKTYSDEEIQRVRDELHQLILKDDPDYFINFIKERYDVGNKKVNPDGAQKLRDLVEKKTGITILLIPFEVARNDLFLEVLGYSDVHGLSIYVTDESGRRKRVFTITFILPGDTKFSLLQIFVHEYEHSQDNVYSSRLYHGEPFVRVVVEGYQVQREVKRLIEWGEGNDKLAQEVRGSVMKFRARTPDEKLHMSISRVSSEKDWKKKLEFIIDLHNPYKVEANLVRAIESYLGQTGEEALSLLVREGKVKEFRDVLGHAKFDTLTRIFRTFSAQSRFLHYPNHKDMRPILFAIAHAIVNTENFDKSKSEKYLQFLEFMMDTMSLVPTIQFPRWQIMFMDLEEASRQFYIMDLLARYVEDDKSTPEDLEKEYIARFGSIYKRLGSTLSEVNNLIVKEFPYYGRLKDTAGYFPVWPGRPRDSRFSRLGHNQRALEVAMRIAGEARRHHSMTINVDAVELLGRMHDAGDNAFSHYARQALKEVFREGNLGEDSNAYQFLNEFLDSKRIVLSSEDRKFVSQIEEMRKARKSKEARLKLSPEARAVLTAHHIVDRIEDVFAALLLGHIQLDNPQHKDLFDAFKELFGEESLRDYESIRNQEQLSRRAIELAMTFIKKHPITKDVEFSADAWQLLTDFQEKYIAPIIFPAQRAALHVDRINEEVKRVLDHLMEKNNGDFLKVRREFILLNDKDLLKLANRLRDNKIKNWKDYLLKPQTGARLAKNRGMQRSELKPKVEWNKHQRNFKLKFKSHADAVLEFLSPSGEAYSISAIERFNSTKVATTELKNVFKCSLSFNDGKKVVFYTKSYRYKLIKNEFKNTQLASRYSLAPALMMVQSLNMLIIKSSQGTEVKSLENRKEMIPSIAYALGRLHGLGIVHGDLNPSGKRDVFKTTHLFRDKKGRITFIDLEDSTAKDPDGRQRDLEKLAVIWGLRVREGEERKLFEDSYQRGNLETRMGGARLAILNSENAVRVYPIQKIFDKTIQPTRTMLYPASNQRSSISV